MDVDSRVVIGIANLNLIKKINIMRINFEKYHFCSEICGRVDYVLKNFLWWSYGFEVWNYYENNLIVETLADQDVDRENLKVKDSQKEHYLAQAIKNFV